MDISGNMPYKTILLNYMAPSSTLARIGLSHSPEGRSTLPGVTNCLKDSYCERGWVCKLNYHRLKKRREILMLQICGFVICNRNSNKENESKLTLYSLVGELESLSPCHGEDRGFESRRGCHKGISPIPRSGKVGRGRGDEKVAFFGNSFLVINCCGCFDVRPSRYIVLTRIAVQHLICPCSSVGQSDGLISHRSVVRSHPLAPTADAVFISFHVRSWGLRPEKYSPFICQIGQTVKSRPS